MFNRLNAEKNELKKRDNNASLREERERIICYIQKPNSVKRLGKQDIVSLPWPDLLCFEIKYEI